MSVYLWLGRHLPRPGATDGLVLVALAAISVPLLTVAAAGSIGAEPDPTRTTIWAFGATAVATLAWIALNFRDAPPGEPDES